MENDTKGPPAVAGIAYLRLLLSTYRAAMQADMERLRQWRERRGAILFANHMMEEEGRVIQNSLTESWKLYRAVSKVVSEISAD